MKQINTNKYLKVGALKNWLAQFDDDVEVVIDTTGLHSDLLGDEDGDDVFPIQALSGRVTPDREQAVVLELAPVQELASEGSDWMDLSSESYSPPLLEWRKDFWNRTETPNKYGF